MRLSREQSLFARKSTDSDKAQEILGLYFDEMIVSRNYAFHAVANTILKSLYSRQSEWGNLEFFGINIRRNAVGLINVDQHIVINKFLLLSNDNLFNIFRSVLASVAYDAYTRPKIIGVVNKASRVTE